MRYEVEKQIDEINKAIATLGLREIPNMKQPTEKEMESALKKATSCMTLIVRALSHKDITMKEFNEELRNGHHSHESSQSHAEPTAPAIYVEKATHAQITKYANT